MLTNISHACFSPAVFWCPMESEVKAAPGFHDTNIILTSCSCRILWRYVQTGNWVYPVFASLSPLGIILFFSASYILSASLYLFGEKINHWKWGQCFSLFSTVHRESSYWFSTLPPNQRKTQSKLSPTTRYLWSQGSSGSYEHRQNKIRVHIGISSENSTCFLSSFK